MWESLWVFETYFIAIYHVYVTIGIEHNGCLSLFAQCECIAHSTTTGLLLWPSLCVCIVFEILLDFTRVQFLFAHYYIIEGSLCVLIALSPVHNIVLELTLLAPVDDWLTKQSFRFSFLYLWRHTNAYRSWWNYSPQNVCNALV